MSLRHSSPQGIILVVLLMGTAAVYSVQVAQAQIRATIIDDVAISGLSADGTVACGNSLDGLNESCRWTAADGLVRLGRSSVEGVGRGAGIPGISADGDHIGNSITSTDSFLTQGIWSKGVGWQQAMPPLPPDGGEIDQSYGSAWGISGDGTTVVGLYWRAGQTGGTAHANKWSSILGFTGLGSQGRDSRANGANYDASVVVGWSASPTISVWQPTVWDENGITVLSPTILWCEAQATNGAGDIIVGDAVDSLSYAIPMQSAAIWVRTESGWNEQLLGVLPGTFGNGTGFARGLDLSEDGNVVVGVNQYDSWSPTGFVWTLEQGMTKADEYFTAAGVEFPESFTVLEVTAVSDDGRVMAGYGRNPLNIADPLRSFVVDLDSATAAPVASREARVTLEGNFPNPFNPSTSIQMSVNASGRVQLEIYDLRGRLVRTVHDGILEAGIHHLRWDGRDESGGAVASGTYFARARSGGEFSEARALTLVK